MKSKQELERITVNAFRGLGLAFLIVGVTYFVLGTWNIVPSDSMTEISVVTGATFLGLMCLLFGKYKKSRIFLCALMSLVLGCVNISGYLNLNILFLAPMIISLYAIDRKTIRCVSIINIIIISISMIIRAYGYGDFVKQNLENYYNVAQVAMAHIITILLEFFCILALYIPYFKYLLSLKDYQSDSLIEKENSTIEALNFCSTAMSYHNKYLSVHIKNVGKITEKILEELDKTGKYNWINRDDYRENLIFSVQFHDIGKIYIDSHILDKPGRLTAEEFETIKKHPEKGTELFDLMPKNVLTREARELCRKVIYEHHERLDGSGYPQGLRGKQISFGAQIVAVADVVDALLSWRPYKAPFTREEFLAKIRQESGKSFNADVCNIVINSVDWLLELSDEGNMELKEIFRLLDKDVERKSAYA